MHNYDVQIQQLRDEIAILKGQKPRPKIPPSSLEGIKAKQPRSRKIRCRKKTKRLHIHATERNKPKNIPAVAVFKGYQQFTVQDIIF